MFVLIDPGHGGSNKGCKAEGLIEKDWTLEMAGMLVDYMTGLPQDIACCMTRDQDMDLLLEERAVVGREHKADLIISLHVNISPDPRTRGMICFHNDTGETAATFIGHAAPRRLQRNSNSKFLAQRKPHWTHHAYNVIAAHENTPTVLVEAFHASHVGNLDYGLSEVGKHCIAMNLMRAIFSYWQHREVLG